MIKNTQLKQGILLALFMLFAYQGYAAEITVYATKNDGSELPAVGPTLATTQGAKFVIYKGPNTVGVGTYDAGTTITGLGIGTYTVHATYDGTSSKRDTIIITHASKIRSKTYKTTNIKFYFSGDYMQFTTGGGGLRSFAPSGVTGDRWSPRELFPLEFSGANPVTFRTGNVWDDKCTLDFTIAYANIAKVEKTIVVLRVLRRDNTSRDYDNPGIAGASFRGGFNPYAWFVTGTTNAQGLLLDLQDGKKINLSYEAKVNNTTAYVGPQNLTTHTNSYYVFKTALVTLKLATCLGAPLSGGTVRYTVAPYAYHFPGGPTIGNGETSADLFPGTYPAEMNYLGMAQVKSLIVPATPATSLTWNTTKLNLNWPYGIVYSGSSGYLNHFLKPGMELLPGTYQFSFKNQQGAVLAVKPISISNGIVCAPITYTPGIVQLRSSTNAGIADIDVEGYDPNFNISAYTNYGKTDASGNLLVLDKNPTHLKMTFKGATQEMAGINFSANPIVTFQTKKVTIDFKTSNGLTMIGATPLVGTNLQYWVDGVYYPFDPASTSGGMASMELLPSSTTSYWFLLAYKGSTQKSPELVMTPNSPANINIPFRTKLVTIDFRDSEGASLDGTNLQYWVDGIYYSFDPASTSGGTASMELLPSFSSSYWFLLAYKGATQKSSELIMTDNSPANITIPFQTKLVTIEFRDGTTLIEGTNLKYWVSGVVHPFEPAVTSGGTASMQLLPSFSSSYWFYLDYYGGTLVSTEQVLTANTTVLFNLNPPARVAAPALSSALSNNTSIAIYPNPAVSSINISLPEGAGTADVKITTLDGRLVHDQKLNTKLVDVSKLPGGIYQVRVTVDGKSQIHRLVIAR